MTQEEIVDVVYNPRTDRYLRHVVDSDDMWVRHPANATHYIGTNILEDLRSDRRLIARRVKLITTYEVQDVSSEEIVEEYRSL